jgi:sugar phosphate isomerase/epimerase
MKTIKRPAIFLAQFGTDEQPFNSLPAIATWAAGLGYKGLQIPTWDRRLVGRFAFSPRKPVLSLHHFSPLQY